MLRDDLQTEHKLARFLSIFDKQMRCSYPYHGNLGQAEDTTALIALITRVLFNSLV
jgi:hypothetical protein